MSNSEKAGESGCKITFEISAGCVLQLLFGRKQLWIVPCFLVYNFC